MSETPAEVVEPKPEPDPETLGPSLWKRLSAAILVFGLFRAVIGVLGVVGFAVGVVVAVLAESSLALLTVSGVLLLAALLVGPDWEEISAAYGSANVQLRRFAQSVKDVAEEADSLEQLRQRLDQLGVEVEQLQPRRPVAPSTEWAETLARRLLQRRQVAPVQSPLNAALQPGLEPESRHELLAPDVYALRLRLNWSGWIQLVECRVKPGGETWSGTPTLTLEPEKRLYQIVFPTMFAGVPVPLPPGEYQVERIVHTPGTSIPPSTVARDTFVVDAPPAEEA